MLTTGTSTTSGATTDSESSVGSELAQDVGSCDAAPIKAFGFSGSSSSSAAAAPSLAVAGRVTTCGAEESAGEHAGSPTLPSGEDARGYQAGGAAGAVGSTAGATPGDGGDSTAGFLDRAVAVDGVGRDELFRTCIVP